MDLDLLLRHQDGVVSRRQLIELRLNDDDIRRRLRRREWSRMFEGVYVDHTGAPTWRQRAWGAVLLHAPATLDASSALAADGFGTASGPAHVLVDAGRRVVDPPGVRTTRSRSWSRDVRDVEYDAQRLLVELDGRLGHELWMDRWADLQRDLLALRSDRVTARAGWGQVLQPCRLAEAVSDLLIARGWTGRPARCGPDCLLM